MISSTPSRGDSWWERVGEKRPCVFIEFVTEALLAEPKRLEKNCAAAGLTPDKTMDVSQFASIRV